jgi:hypothetical protein
VEKLAVGLNEGQMAKEILSEAELDEVKHLFLLTVKPEIFVINLSESRITNHKLRSQYADQIGVDEADVLMVSAKIEAELASLSDEEQRLYMEELGLTESGIERMARIAYHKLGLISFLTAGEKECRAWTIRKGSFAPQAAGVIHTDFEKKFIKAKVCTFNNFVGCGGWKKAAEAGKVRMEGKEYVVEDGDVVEFMIGG